MTEKEKEKEKLKELAINVCNYNNININRLIKYCDNNVLVKYESPSNEYQVKYDFNMYYSTEYILKIEYKEYCLSVRAFNPNWFSTNLLTYEIDIKNINSIMNKYEQDADN